MKDKNKIFIVLYFCFFFANSFAQSFQEKNPAQYKKALILKQNYINLLEKQNVDDPVFYISIVFPELVRYSERRDKLEVFLNSLTYTTISEYEGFSIGSFQMKPNFIMQLEECISSDFDFYEKYSDLLISDSLSDFSTRYERIIRLQNDKFLVKYLMAFVDISLKKYNLQSECKEMQLKYLGAIYNCGFKNKLDEYDNFFKIKAFPYGIYSEKSQWNYSDLVLECYKTL